MERYVVLYIYIYIYVCVCEYIYNAGLMNMPLVVALNEQRLHCGRAFLTLLLYIPSLLSLLLLHHYYYVIAQKQQVAHDAMGH